MNATLTHSSRTGAEKGLSFLGRAGLAGRTGFYLILTALTLRIAVLGGRSGRQADAHGALAIVSRPLIGKVAIGAVAVGFLLFGVGRLVGAVQDDSVSKVRRVLTVFQGLFYVALAYVPASFLAGNRQTGSQQEQQKTTARVLALPAGRPLLVAVGIIFIAVCAQQIRGALKHDFRDGLRLNGAPRPVRAVTNVAGVVGITARALVFLPVGIFLIVAAFQNDPAHSYGTDAELLALSGHVWGIAVLVIVAAGLATFAAFSAIETRYREVISAK
ncbi:MAG TPA: DUF1206 domain-containing protein [Acidimicrobiales bacterium]|nr:DUF1206 domain-containing protein [Acidimicrobiales bacterium]